MILADTSVWIDHWRRGNARLAVLLGEGQVLTHPFVLGELAMGTLSRRAVVLAELRALPAARQADHEEVMTLIDRRNLWGRGLGWVDAHLLASALLERAQLWSLDSALAEAAGTLGRR